MTSTGSGAGAPASVLAIDAGNSKTDVAVVTVDGKVIGTARGGGFQPPAVGVETAVDTLADAVRRAFAQAGVDGVTHVSACLANADLPVEEEQLAAALHARAWGAAVDVRNDTFAILRSGVAEPRGVAVVCGAGINCVGMRPDGRTARFPALGRISGDWGGGWGLAEEALWHAARAEDGRGGPTALARALPAHFGLDSMYALIEALHLEHVEPIRRHELTPVLFATAAEGDPVARSLVDRLADEIVTMATVALTRLDLLTEETPVLLGGGVLAARHPQVDDRIRELLAARAPKAVPRVVTARPVLGAALLGLDRLGAPAEAHARVRDHYENA
jgi:N-acetylglucosamine kinase-like BadF-type ATPase